MERVTSPRPLRHLFVTMAAVAAVLGLSSTVAAGGWAVTSLDPVPMIAPGEPVEIGFTIRQHGVHPANVEGDVGIEIASATGDTVFAPAEQVGSVGHYVSTVTFPAAGEYGWLVRQGWFAAQDLGSVTVRPVDSAGTWTVPTAIGWLLPITVVGLLLVAGLDVVAGRRHRRRLAAA